MKRPECLRAGWLAKLILGPGLLVVVAGPISRASEVASDPASVTKASGDVRSLVAQLGDEAFSIRESATNQLIRQGSAAKPELLVAVRDPDAEVRHRARQVLEKIVA